MPFLRVGEFHQRQFAQTLFGDGSSGVVAARSHQTGTSRQIAEVMDSNKKGGGMRVYEIKRSATGLVRCLVRTAEGQGETLRPYKLPHAALHSPTGFECGYGGSGPADLAASILADFFNVPARTVKRAYRKGLDDAQASKVVSLHQPFKAAVIAGIHVEKGSSVKLTGDEIAAWIAHHEAGGKSMTASSNE